MNLDYRAIGEAALRAFCDTEREESPLESPLTAAGREAVAAMIPALKEQGVWGAPGACNLHCPFAHSDDQATHCSIGLSVPLSWEYAPGRHDDSPCKPGPDCPASKEGK